MTLRTAITNAFAGKAFHLPLHEAFPDVQRFELSESGKPLSMVLQALDKARVVCHTLFAQTPSLTVCLRDGVGERRFALRPLLRTLRVAGIAIPPVREVWLTEEVGEEGEPEQWLHLAFDLPLALLPNLLWCAFTRDFPKLQPRLSCDVYLFDLPRGIMAFPFDDRGMDVVEGQCQSL